MPSKKTDYQNAIEKIDKEIQNYEQIALDIKNKAKQLDQLNVKGFEKEAAVLRDYMKDLDSHSKVKRLFFDLSGNIKDYKKRYEIARKQLDDMPSDLFKKDISKIEAHLSDPKSIFLAEEQIEELKKKIDDRNRIGFPIELLQYSGQYLIGNGGFARVYKAKNNITDRIVAVKIPINNEPSIGKSFMRELKNWVGLKHKNIVEVFNYNILPVPYLEMELCDFCLANIKKPLEIQTAIKYILGISDGLKYAHTKKIVHLDLKPQNILLKEDIPKISDWGLSKLITEHGTTTIGLSLPYAAPEQFSKKFGRKDEQTDVWQVGVLLFHLLTDKVPFTGSDFTDYGENITSKDIFLSKKQNELSADISDILKKCLAKNKKERYKTIYSLQKDLKKLAK